MWEALKICAPITLMTFAIFTRSNMVVNPGWMQLADTILVLVATCGITFAMFGRYLENPGADIVARVLLAAVSFLTMFHPNDTFVWVPGVIVLVALAFGIWRHRIIAPPKTAAVAAEPSARGDEIGGVLAEARRDIG
jgi:hypothetical protein